MYLRHPTLLMQLAGRIPRLIFLCTMIEVGPWSRHALHGTGCTDRFPFQSEHVWHTGWFPICIEDTAGAVQHWCSNEIKKNAVACLPNVPSWMHTFFAHFFFGPLNEFRRDKCTHPNPMIKTSYNTYNVQTNSPIDTVPLASIHYETCAAHRPVSMVWGKITVQEGFWFSSHEWHGLQDHETCLVNLFSSCYTLHIFGFDWK